MGGFHSSGQSQTDDGVGMIEESRIRAGLWGVLVADAMGVPHEFKRSEAIPDQLEMAMSRAYKKTYKEVPYGTWSDDGSLTLALADSLAERGRLVVRDFADRMLAWYHRAAYTPDGVRFDIGNVTRSALNKLTDGVSPAYSGVSTESSATNGSLMRTLPLALFSTGTDEDLYEDAQTASAVTHAHPIAKAACGVYCVAARRVLRGEPVAPSFVKALKMCKFPLHLPNPPTGTGFVLDSLSAATLEYPSYEQAVQSSIKIGNDTDTTAAIVGGIQAVRFGIESIPEKWMNGLRGQSIANEIIERFIESRRDRIMTT